MKITYSDRTIPTAKVYRADTLKAISHMQTSQPIVPDGLKLVTINCMGERTPGFVVEA